MTSRSLGHRAPLLWIVLPLMAGLVTGRLREFGPVPWLLAGAAATAGIALVASWRGWRLFAPAIVAAMFLAGAASYALHRPRIAAWDSLPPREARVTLRVERAFPPIAPQRASGIARVVHAEERLQEIAGQRVYFSLSLRPEAAVPIRSAVIAASGVIAALPRDPAANTFDGYLANEGVNFRLTRGRISGGVAPPSAYRRFCARMAARFEAILGAGVEAKQPELVAVFRAMLLGEQNELSDSQTLLFRRSGTMHVFSISGLHIAVIATGLHALLLLVRLPKAVRFPAALAALWLYVAITGEAPSAVRAFVMVALVEASLVLRVPRNPLAALTTSALLVLLADPLQLFSASFQMSYGIVAALLLLGLPLAERWESALPLFRDLPKAAWTWHQRARDRLWRAGLTATAIGVAASLVSAITGVLFFNLFTPGSLLANLWLIPAAMIVILTGLVSLLCGLLGFSAGSALANHAAVLVLWGVQHGLGAFAAVPGLWIAASFRAPWIGGVALAAVLAALAAGYASAWRGWARGYWAPFAVVLVALAFGAKFG
ncbi:MAG TPA: ComEC/Rec2 family competence protein [Opitutus sp.]|nr:ComEC/Rec2 family competence protein [Opitutus sp.]